ncbi:MAG: glycosyltransferase family 4 protein [Gemmatimonadaceae bacterium]|nr:glycosyltransferase family 4 protein [Gemmatimonadaceae bacterium]
MRIALFHHLPSGGALALVAQSARILADAGHEVGLFTFGSAEQAFAPWPLEGHREVLPLDLEGNGALRRYDAATHEMARRIEAWAPDAVWVEKCRLFGHPPILTMLTRPTVLHTHEPLRVRALEQLAPVASFDWPAVEPGASFAPLRKLLRLPRHLRIRRGDAAAVRAAGRVVTSSAFTAEWLRRAYGVSATVLAPGIDTRRFSPASVAARSASVLSVGRLSPLKGHDLAIRALGRLPASQRPALDIACDEAHHADRVRLETLAAEQGVSLRIHHRVSSDDLVALYRQSRAVLCAAYREPFGLSAPEAMACGTPVIAVREGGFAETVVDGETGFLLPREVDAWQQPLSALMSDNALVDRLGRAGIARVANGWSLEGWRARAAAASGLPL